MTKFNLWLTENLSEKTAQFGFMALACLVLFGPIFVYCLNYPLEIDQVKLKEISDNLYVLCVFLPILLAVTINSKSLIWFVISTLNILLYTSTVFIVAFSEIRFLDSGDGMGGILIALLAAFFCVISVAVVRNKIGNFYFEMCIIRNMFSAANYTAYFLDQYDIKYTRDANGYNIILDHEKGYLSFYDKVIEALPDFSMITNLTYLELKSNCIVNLHPLMKLLNGSVEIDLSYNPIDENIMCVTELRGHLPRCTIVSDNA